MDPLGAIKLREERNRSGFAAFRQGLDDLGNLDTYLKDRNLTVGDERPGVFGGNWWQTWKVPKQPVATDGATPAKGFAAFLPPNNLELADIHRFAKIRGLNHDQATIDEKTSRPERDRQHQLAVQDQEIKKENKEFELQKSAWDKLAQEQTQIRTRLNGSIAQIPAYQAQLAASTDEQERKSLKEVISYLKSQINADLGTLKEVESKMNEHNAPDYYIRRQMGELGETDSKPFSTDDDDIKYSEVAEKLLGNSTDEPIDSQIKKTAKENGLDLPQFEKALEKALKRNRGNVDYKSGVKDSTLGQTGKTLSNKSAEASAKQNEAAVQKQIAALRNGKIGISNFLQNPNYANYRLIEKRLGNYKAEGGILSKIPYAGKFLESFKDMDENKFNINKSVILNDAKESLLELEAELNAMDPPKTRKEAKL